MKWIPVNEKMPEDNETCLVTVKSKSTGGLALTVGNCEHQKCWFLQTEIGTAAYPISDWIVVAWMYAPEVYKE